jgi:DNA-binding LacI/PurR family transcriptional regulator
VTAADVGEEAGVSRATVGFVLNGTPGISISVATAQRVRDAAARLGYRPHRAAQSLARGTSRVVLLALPDWPIEHAFRVNLEEVEQRLDAAGYAMASYTRHAKRGSRPLWELLSPDVVVSYVPFSESEQAEFRKAGIDRVFPDTPTVLEQNPIVRAGPELQVGHLVEQGRAVLAYAASADPRLAELSAVRERVARSEAVRRGVDLRHVAPIDIDDPDTVRTVERWADAGVTGVVAFNDDVAAATIHRAQDLGLRVPLDLAVVGHDDTPLARLYNPAISSITISSTALGTYMADIALAVAQDKPLPDFTTLPVSVVPRCSSVGDEGQRPGAG